MPNNADLIRRWFEEVWNQGREATIDELCSKQAVGHGQTHDGTDIVGPEHFKQFWRTFRGAFSNIHVAIQQTIEQGEMVMARWVLTSKHAGEFMGVPPSGKAIKATGMSVQRFVDGKIVEAWDNWDQLSVMLQLGVVAFQGDSRAHRS